MSSKPFNPSVIMMMLIVISLSSISFCIDPIFRDLNVASFGKVDTPLPIKFHIKDLFMLGILHLKGLSTKLLEPLFDLDLDNNVAIFLENSRLDLYDDNGTLISAERCSIDYFKTRNVQYFSNLYDHSIEISMNTNVFTRPLCPYLFQHANMHQLIFINYVHTTFYRNIFHFYEIKNDSNHTIDLNIRIHNLTFNFKWRYHLKTSWFDNFLFAKALRVHVINLVASFENDFFKNFRQMNQLEIKLTNLHEFLHATNNEWLNSIFSYAVVFESKQALIDKAKSLHIKLYNFVISRDLDPTYLYPDEDFCLFKHFPRLKAIVMSDKISMNDNYYYSTIINASCTFKFLSQQNYILLHAVRDQDMSGNFFEYFNDDQLDECNFDQRLAICATSATVYVKFKQHTKFYDATYALIWIDFIGPIVSFPVFSAIAFSLNLLVIAIVRSRKNKKEKLFEAKTFRFIEINSSFNCIECLIYQFQLMSLCLGANSVFCSTVRDSPIQFYFQVMNIYLSEVMKTCSSMSGLLFSLQRYFETSKSKNKYLVSFSEITMRRLVSLVLIYGFVCSVPVFFSIHYDFTHTNTYDSPDTFYLISGSKSLRNQIMAIFFIAHYIINDVAVLVLNLVVDGFLILVIRSSLKEKILKLKSMSNDSELSELESKKLKEELKKKTSVERKANAMILINAAIYLVCRVPEVIGIFIIYFSYDIGGASCDRYYLCNTIYNSIEYLYMLSYLINIFIYYKFNSNFKKGLRNFVVPRDSSTT